MKYECVNCGKVISEKELNDEIECGSMGMCFCEYTSEDRVLNQYVPIKE